MDKLEKAEKAEKAEKVEKVDKLEKGGFLEGLEWQFRGHLDSRIGFLEDKILE